jgi:sulfoxide reductase heme-binding subunit YedZ
MTTRDPMDYGWWLASRASGLVALALITLSVGVGLAMAGKAFRRPGLPRKLMALHEHAALGGLIAIAVHGITLLGDRWLDPGPAGIAVPFVMDYRPVYTGLGIVAGYLAAALGLSFYTRKRIGAKLWRKLHRATIAVYVLAVIHTLGAGSDVAWVRPAMLITGAPVLYLLVLRMLPQRARGERRTRTGTSAVPGAS